MLEASLRQFELMLGPMAGPFFSFGERLLGAEARTYWYWLAGALILMHILHRMSRSAGSALPEPRRVWTHRSSILDYQFLLLRKFGAALIVVPILASAVAVGHWGAGVLATWLGPGPEWTPGLAVFLGLTLVRLFLFDVGHYISHYLQHRVPFFWEFHKIHHAAEVMTPITAFRAHPLEYVMDGFFEVPLQALCLAPFYYLYGVENSIGTVAAVNVFIIIYYFVEALRHSHVRISFGRRLEHILQSPVQHQVHHSNARRHQDKNFSQYFSVIDWIGGTLYVPEPDEALEFGLTEETDPELNTVWSLYWVPVRRAVGGLVRPGTAPGVGKAVEAPLRKLDRAT